METDLCKTKYQSSAGAPEENITLCGIQSFKSGNSRFEEAQEPFLGRHVLSNQHNFANSEELKLGFLYEIMDSHTLLLADESPFPFQLKLVKGKNELNVSVIIRSMLYYFSSLKASFPEIIIKKPELDDDKFVMGMTDQLSKELLFKLIPPIEIKAEQGRPKSFWFVPSTSKKNETPPFLIDDGVAKDEASSVKRLNWGGMTSRGVHQKRTTSMARVYNESMTPRVACSSSLFKKEEDIQMELDQAKLEHELIDQIFHLLKGLILQNEGTRSENEIDHQLDEEVVVNSSSTYVSNRSCNMCSLLVGQQPHNLQLILSLIDKCVSEFEMNLGLKKNILECLLLMVISWVVEVNIRDHIFRDGAEYVPGCLLLSKSLETSMTVMVRIMPNLTELLNDQTELEIMENRSIMGYLPWGIVLLLNVSRFSIFDIYNNRLILDLPQLPEHLVDLDGWKATFTASTVYVVGDASELGIPYSLKFYILSYGRGSDEWAVNSIPGAPDRSSLTMVGPICIEGNLVWITEYNMIEIYYSDGRYNIIPIDVDFNVRNCGVSVLEHDGFVYIFKGEPEPLMIRFQVDSFFEDEEYERVYNPPEGFDFFFLARGKGVSRAAYHEGDGIIFLAKEAAYAHVSAYRDMICLRNFSVCREAPNIPGGACECMFGWFFPS